MIVALAGHLGWTQMTSETIEEKVTSFRTKAVQWSGNNVHEKRFKSR